MPSSANKIAVFAVLALTLLAGPASAGGLVADPARPRIALADGQLSELLAQRKNAPVILNFWASWCQPCRDEMPSLQRIGERWRGRGLSVLTVAVADNHERASQFLWDIGVVLPVLDDPSQTTARSLGVKTLPATLVLDRDHRIVARGRGAIDWSNPAIDRQLEGLLR